jgi:hypothetical protein
MPVGKNANLKEEVEGYGKNNFVTTIQGIWPSRLYLQIIGIEVP